MLSATLGRMSREDGKAHASLLSELFLVCLDYRAQETKVIVIMSFKVVSSRNKLVSWCLLSHIYYSTLPLLLCVLQGMSSLSSVEAVEESCLDAFTILVVKLSEIQFRPLFLKLLDWASNPNSPRARTITFYHLADR